MLRALVHSIFWIISEPIMFFYLIYNKIETYNKNHFEFIKSYPEIIYWEKGDYFNSKGHWDRDRQVSGKFECFSSDGYIY